MGACPLAFTRLGNFPEVVKPLEKFFFEPLSIEEIP